MSLKFLRVNPEAANITGAIVFICAVLASVGTCAGFVLFYLLPYLFHHISVRWH
jgi:hypothetical protein